MREINHIFVSSHLFFFISISKASNTYVEQRLFSPMDYLCQPQKMIFEQNYRSEPSSNLNWTEPTSSSSSLRDTWTWIWSPGSSSAQKWLNLNWTGLWPVYPWPKLKFWPMHHVSHLWANWLNGTVYAWWCKVKLMWRWKGHWLLHHRYHWIQDQIEWEALGWLESCQKYVHPLPRCSHWGFAVAQRLLRRGWRWSTELKIPSESAGSGKLCPGIDGSSGVLSTYWWLWGNFWWMSTIRLLPNQGLGLACSDLSSTHVPLQVITICSPCRLLSRLQSWHSKTFASHSEFNELSWGLEPVWEQVVRAVQTR